MANLTSRLEFRTILKQITNCLDDSLPAPLGPLTPEQMHFWLHEITLEDLYAVLADRQTSTDHREAA